MCNLDSTSDVELLEWSYWSELSYYTLTLY